MKKHILGLSLAALVATGAITAAGAADPRDTRRTLFVPVGQEQIVLEAPLSMCFMDQTDKNEGLFFSQMADALKAAGDEVLLAVFAPCDALANIGSTGSVEILKNMGTITWENPLVGEKTPLERGDYLETREAGYKDDILNKMAGWLDAYGDTDPDQYQVEGKLRRDDNSVSVGFRSAIAIDYEKFRTVGVAATTTLRHFPIEVMVRATEKREPSVDRLHDLIDAFLAQQIALND